MKDNFAITNKAVCYGIGAAMEVIISLLIVFRWASGLPQGIEFACGILVGIATVAISELLIITEWSED